MSCQVKSKGLLYGYDFLGINSRHDYEYDKRTAPSVTPYSTGNGMVSYISEYSFFVFDLCGDPIFESLRPISAVVRKFSESTRPYTRRLEEIYDTSVAFICDIFWYLFVDFILIGKSLPRRRRTNSPRRKTDFSWTRFYRSS